MPEFSSELEQILGDLVTYKSVTPEDVGCQEYMQNYLKKLNFKIETFDNPPVANFYAQFGEEGPLFIFAGHTDVVTAGDLAAWESNPYELTNRDNMLYGRGVADMKGSLASMLIFAKQYVSRYQNSSGRLGFLITSGEEGDDFLNGTPYVMQKLIERGIKPDYCIVGEPSSTNTIGDVIKIGRRGSLSGKLSLHGMQGHVAYPHLAKNPIHLIAGPLNDLTKHNFNDADENFPASSFQVTNIQAGGKAGNVIPGNLEMSFNFRYSVKQTSETLKSLVYNYFNKYNLIPEITWTLSGEPFLTVNSKLIEISAAVIKEIVGVEVELSTSGGTSDGRFIAPYGVELIELGPVNKTIHKVNESVSLRDLEILVNLYFEICKRCLGAVQQ
ncbi:MAG: succinyl-diaminopimelate desuccinylase [Legionellales bacterium RIFCSPHIGHO2_12_FULL_35_11]|nr:MAG: succinyl-diaminopimelate desuccinylase [Legionellales bacterium RIFCSPHIGHO2_12_FULL_35_11]